MKTIKNLYKTLLYVCIFFISLPAVGGEIVTMELINNSSHDIYFESAEIHDFNNPSLTSGTIYKKSESSPVLITVNKGSRNYNHNPRFCLGFSVEQNKIIFPKLGIVGFDRFHGISTTIDYNQATFAPNAAISVWVAYNPRAQTAYYYFYDSGNPPSLQTENAICSVGDCNQRYVVYPIEKLLPYYPSGCTVGENCKCVQDAASGNIWRVNGERYSGQWSDWCSADPQNPGYDPNCASAISGGVANGSSGGVSLFNANKAGMCGLNDGKWHLPTASNLSSAKNILTYVNLSNENPSNGFSDLKSLANISFNLGYWIDDNLGVWMNNNGFTNVNSNPVSAPYWLSGSNGNSNAFVINMNNGSITNDSQQGLSYGVMLVHENK